MFYTSLGLCAHMSMYIYVQENPQENTHTTTNPTKLHLKNEHSNKSPAAPKQKPQNNNPHNTHQILH